MKNKTIYWIVGIVILIYFIRVAINLGVFREKTDYDKQQLGA